MHLDKCVGGVLELRDNSGNYTFIRRAVEGWEHAEPETIETHPIPRETIDEYSIGPPLLMVDDRLFELGVRALSFNSKSQSMDSNNFT